MFRALSVLLKLAPLFCLFAAQQSMAAVAVASLDWSQLQVSVFAIPGQSLPAFTYFGQTTQLTADSATAGDSSDSRTHTLFNWTAPFSITSDTPGAHGEVQASAEAPRRAHRRAAFPDPPVFFPPDIRGSGRGTRTASFGLDAPAALVFNIPYSMSVTGTDFSNFSDASVDGSVTFSTFDSSSFP